MRRADRLFQLVQYLQGRRLTTARQIAERLQVSERTVYRDVQDLVLSGVPIEGEAGVGYVLRPGFHLPPLMFNADELEALVVGARIMDAWAGDKLAAAARDALQKIDAVLPARLKSAQRDARVFAPAFPDRKLAAPRFDAIREAINGKRKIRVQYQRADDEESQRIVWPLGLVFWGNVWTLAAWCELRGDYRTFRIDRIQALQVLNDVFVETETISLQSLLRQYREEHAPS